MLIISHGVKKLMQYVLLVLVSLIAYGAGVYLLLRITPMLLRRQYDEGLFLGIAALDIFGALLAFGGVVLPLALFSGALPVRILGVLLLLGLLVVSVRLTRDEWYLPLLAHYRRRLQHLPRCGYSLLHCANIRRRPLTTQIHRYLYYFLCAMIDRNSVFVSTHR